MTEPAAAPKARALDIVHRDQWLVAVNKPSGLLVHRGWAQDDVVAVDLLHTQLGQRVWPLHRLDRGTSGVLLFALDADTAKHVSSAFERGEVRKRYLALIRGLGPEQQLVDYSLRRVDHKSQERQPAQTRIRRLASVIIGQGDEPPTERHYSLVEATPLTGRTHQIRRHLKHLSHPIIGDVRYGKGAQNRLFRARFGLHRLALHAAELCIPHPALAHELCVHAPLPSDLSEPLAAMGLGSEY